MAMGRMLSGWWSSQKSEPALTGFALDEEETPTKPEAYADESAEEDEDIRIAAAAPAAAMASTKSAANRLKSLLGQYTPPPLSLLSATKGGPASATSKATPTSSSARSQNFGIEVELDEISIGPSVTRYAIKPAEGVRLQKIVDAPEQSRARARGTSGAHRGADTGQVAGRHRGAELRQSDRGPRHAAWSRRSLPNSDKPLLGGARPRHRGRLDLWQHRARCRTCSSRARPARASRSPSTRIINSLLYRCGPAAAALYHDRPQARRAHAL